MNLRTSDWQELQELVASTKQLSLTIVGDDGQADAMEGKFKDLVLLYGVAFDYTRRYVAVIEQEHRRCGAALDFTAPLTQSAQTLQDLTRIMLAAYLVSYETFFDKFHERLNSPHAHKWLKQRRGDVLLDCMHRLRNMDTHNEPLQTVMGTRFLVHNIEKVADDDEHTHLHWDLQHQGVGFNIDALSRSQRFRPKHVEVMASKPIVELLHDGIHALRDVVSDAITAGHLTADPSHFGCPCMRTPAGSSPSPQT